MRFCASAPGALITVVGPSWRCPQGRASARALGRGPCYARGARQAPWMAERRVSVSGPTISILKAPPLLLTAV